MTARTTAELPSTAPRQLHVPGAFILSALIFIALVLAAVVAVNRSPATPQVGDPAVPVEIDAWARPADPAEQHWGSMQSDTRARFPDVDAWAQGQERRDN